MRVVCRGNCQEDSLESDLGISGEVWEDMRWSKASAASSWVQYMVGARLSVYHGQHE